MKYKMSLGNKIFLWLSSVKMVLVLWAVLNDELPSLSVIWRREQSMHTAMDMPLILLQVTHNIIIEVV